MATLGLITLVLAAVFYVGGVIHGLWWQFTGRKWSWELIKNRRTHE